MKTLTTLSAVKLVEGIKTKKFSCVEVINAYLAQIEYVNPKINALVQPINKELALKLAKDANF